MPGSPERTDRELMLAVRDGDLGALDTLFARHHTRLYAFLARLTGDTGTAEDLVQEVFLRLLRFRERYAGDGEFISWLYRIARNLATDDHRRRRETVPLEILELPDDGAPLPLERLTLEERQAQLERALAALPATHREVLLLRGVEGLSHRDVAEVLGCSEGAVRVRMHRAVAALKRQWSAMNGETA